MIPPHFGVDAASSSAIQRAALFGTPLGTHERRQMNFHAGTEQRSIETPGDRQHVIPNRLGGEPSQGHAMPQLVALFNGFGGGASVFVAGAALIRATSGAVDPSLQLTIATAASAA